MSKTETKPHRRLSLTLPTTPPVEVQENPAPTPKTEAVSRPETGSEETPAPVLESVRVMAYLTPDEAGLLDELWLELRRQDARASKSDILRAALCLASEKKDELTEKIVNQHVSTSLRQRGRKITSR